MASQPSQDSAVSCQYLTPKSTIPAQSAGSLTFLEDDMLSNDK